jgi:O-antigen/teichoic acid export membrane protein
MSDRADVGEESKRYRVEPPEEGRGILMSKPQTRKETQSRGASEHRKLARNSSGVLLAMIVANVALMGTSIMTSRLLGPKGRGQLYDTAQVTTWLVVLGGLGLGTAATYFTARGERPRSIVLGNSVLLGLVFGSAIVGGGYGVIALGGVTMHKVPASYLLIAILAVPFALVLGNVQSVYLGSQRFREFIQITVGLTALPLLLIGVALLAFGGGARAAIIASALSTATLAVVFLVRAIRILGISWRLERAYFKTATSYGLRIQVATVLTLLGYRQDVFVVNHYKGPGAVGIYAAAVAVAESLWMLSQAVSYALFPRIAEAARSRRYWHETRSGSRPPRPPSSSCSAARSSRSSTRAPLQPRQVPCALYFWASSPSAAPACSQTTSPHAGARASTPGSPV